MPADMHVHNTWGLVEKVVVERRDLQTGILERRHHGRYLLFRQYEVAHNHRIRSGLAERDPASKRQRRFEFHAFDGDFEIAAREAYFVSPIRLYLASASDRLFNRLPLRRFVVVLLGYAGHCCDKHKEKYIYCNHLSGHICSPNAFQVSWVSILFPAM